MMRMKKLIVTVAAFLGIVLGLNAQQAFKSLAIGFEAGTTGLGVEVAVPIVTNRIVLKGGLTSPSLTYPFSFSGDMQPVNNEIIRANDYLMQSGLDDRINTRFSDLSLSASSTLNSVQPVSYSNSTRLKVVRFILRPVPIWEWGISSFPRLSVLIRRL